MIGDFKATLLLLKREKKAVDAVFESIQEGLEEDGIVKIGQWGTYSVDDM
jgi:nucleoid DNA-binding protein